MNRLSDFEVERMLGYSPCVCGVLDGTWHSKCYVGKTQKQIDAQYKTAILKAREHLKSIAANKASQAIKKASGGY